MQYYNFVDTAITALVKHCAGEGLQKFVELENLNREPTGSEGGRESARSISG